MWLFLFVDNYTTKINVNTVSTIITLVIYQQVINITVFMNTTVNICFIVFNCVILQKLNHAKR